MKNSGGLAVLSGLFNDTKRGGWYTSIGSASGFTQLETAEEGTQNTAFRDPHGEL